MVEAKFGFFQMAQKRMFGHALERVEAGLGETPEELDAADVRGAQHELVSAVADTEVPVKTDIHQPVVAAPTVGIDHGGHVNFTADNGLQGLFRAVGDDFRVHLPAAFEQAEDNGFATGPAGPFAAHPPGAEVAFVEFNCSVQFGRYWAPRLQAAAQAQVPIVDRAHAQAREPSRVRGCQIQGEESRQVAKFGLGNFAALIVAARELRNKKLYSIS